MGKGGKKKTKKADYEALTAAEPGTGGWHTGSTAAMLLDEEKASTSKDAGMTDVDTIQPKNTKTSSAQGMDIEDGSKPGDKKKKKPGAGATSSVPGLGVVRHSLKRGDRTTNQKKRKVVKLAKAVARAEKVDVRISSTQQRKSQKLTLKHVY